MLSFLQKKELVMYFLVHKNVDAMAYAFSMGTGLSLKTIWPAMNFHSLYFYCYFKNREYALKAIEQKCKKAERILQQFEVQYTTFI